MKLSQLAALKLFHLGSLAITLLPLALISQASAEDIFPYSIYADTLDNGLKIFMVPFNSPGIVAYYSIVRAGSRNEVEPGNSGFAHFFEHMMFRGTEKYPPDEYNQLFKELGSDANAYTTDDYTCYHCIIGGDGLERVIEVESDRFMNLKYSVPDFKQESKAVLGEYYKNYSNPFSKLYEKLRDTAYTTHTYKHTTMGFLRDIEDMPNKYDYSLGFFDRYYRPDNTVILIVGDFDKQNAMSLIRKYYDAWESKPYKPDIPHEPEQTSFKSAHIDWENETLPYLAIAYHIPAFSATSTECAGIDILADLLFGSNSPLYQKLVIKDQSVEYISSYVPDRRDPSLFMIFSRIKRDELIDEVKDQIYKAIEEVQKKRVDPKRLSDIKSRIKYSFAMSLDTASSIAEHLTHYINLTGDPAMVNQIYRRYAEVTPQEIQRLANRYLTKSNCTEVTLTGVKK